MSWSIASKAAERSSRQRHDNFLWSCCTESTDEVIVDVQKSCFGRMMFASHHSVFYSPDALPATNSIKALKAEALYYTSQTQWYIYLRSQWPNEWRWAPAYTHDCYLCAAVGSALTVTHAALEFTQNTAFFVSVDSADSLTRSCKLCVRTCTDTLRTCRRTTDMRLALSEHDTATHSRHWKRCRKLMPSCSYSSRYVWYLFNKCPK